MPLRSDFTRRHWILAAGVWQAGCHSTAVPPRPTIQFTRIPKADHQGSDQHDIIEGTVTGSRDGQQLVLYAKSESWWLQPLAEAPFTRILPKGTWLNATHLGSDYAALLVDPGYTPARNMKELPSAGGLVAAVAEVPGSAHSPSTILPFSGYDWRVRTAASNRGGKRNPYAASNAWVDPNGALHLRVRRNADHFECAEVALTRSLGYGAYSFHVRDVSPLASDIVLEMFTWDYAGAGQNNREMDIVVRRRSPAKQIARFILQPYQVASNLHEFNLPPGPYVYSFRWAAGQIEFAATTSDRRNSPIAQHQFTLGVPTPGLESARIALYLQNGPAKQPAEGEVVIDRFEYTP